MSVSIPHATLLLLSYHSAATLRAAIVAASEQDFEHLEIIVADDASTDGSADVAEQAAAELELGQRFRLLRHPHNLGIVGNIAESIKAARAQFIVLAAGDDMSHPSRVRRLYDAWRNAGSPEYAVVHSDVRPVDHNGVPITDWNETQSRPPWTLGRLAAGGNGPLGAGCAITANLLEHPGPIDRTVVHEDRVLPFRALLLGGKVLHVDARLVDYRVAGGISRFKKADRLSWLTEQSAMLIARTLPDARQRLRDACAVGAAPAVIERCRRFVIEQEALLRLARREPLIPTIWLAICAGARPVPIVIYLLRYLRAFGERLCR